MAVQASVASVAVQASDSTEDDPLDAHSLAGARSLRDLRSLETRLQAERDSNTRLNLDLDVAVGTDGRCSPRHSIPLNSIHEGSQCN